MNKVRQLWNKLRSSFWFIPSLIVVFSVALAVALIEADSAGSDRWLARWPRLFGAGAQGARGMMSTIAGSMMTVVGVMFSMILVVLALASSQYTSRILRNFMRNHVTQVVLGIFAGIFTYCLIVLRTIRSGDEGAFVPNLAVFFGLVLAKKSGYIQNVNNAVLLRLARERKTIVRMEYGIGDFVVLNTTLVSLALENPPDKETISALQKTFSISSHRTLEQDAAFGIRQIVDVALKALSPGINDTTTAVMCVDYLTTIMAQLALLKLPSPYRYEEGELRLISKDPNFESFLAESFDQIRGSATGNIAIMLRLLGALQTIAGLTASPYRRRALREQVQWIAELAERTLESAHDRAMIETRFAHVREAFETEPTLYPGEENE